MKFRWLAKPRVRRNPVSGELESVSLPNPWDWNLEIPDADRARRWQGQRLQGQILTRPGAYQD